MTRRRGLREGRNQSEVETDEGVQAVSFKCSEKKNNVRWEDVKKGITGSEENSREKKKVFGLDQVGRAVFGWFSFFFFFPDFFLPRTRPLWELQHEIIIYGSLIQGLP